MKIDGHKDKEIKRLRWLVESANARYDELWEEKEKRLEQARDGYRQARRERMHFLIFVPVAFVAGIVCALQAMPLS